MQEKIQVLGNVVAKLIHPDGSSEYFYGKNLLVDTGELYYTKEIAQEGSPVPDFSTNGRMVLNNPASADTPAAGDTYNEVNNPIDPASIKVIDATYPTRDDQDADNPGAGVNVFTWRTTWTGADFDTESANDITGGAIIDTASPVGGSPLLNHWNFAIAFGKLSTSTLIVWINHTLVGV